MFQSILGLQPDSLWTALGITPAHFTLGLVVVLFLLLAFSALAPDLVLILGVVVLLMRAATAEIPRRRQRPLRSHLRQVSP